MVNHFASLLSNLNLTVFTSAQEAVILATSLEEMITTSGGDFVVVDTLYSLLKTSKLDSLLINKDYTELELPDALQKFHDLLFPAAASTYYKQFLLYCYLRIIDSTDLAGAVKDYDARITYDLDEIYDYFRFRKLSTVVSNTQDFGMLVTGNFSTPKDAQYASNEFVIKQIADTDELYIFSSTEGRYYKSGYSPSKNRADMSVHISPASSGMTTAPISIGDLGLKFSISGNLDEFTATDNKIWSFTAEAPFNFNFKELFDDLYSNQRIVGDMLSYNEYTSNNSYVNIWNNHYNDVYRFAGLLLAYVERVHSVWVTMT
jgi:hypothetical protein